MSSVNVSGHGGAAQPSDTPLPAKPEPANSQGWAKFCGRCGHELKPGARFCGTCGHPVLTADRGRLPPTTAPPGPGPPQGGLPPRPAHPGTFRLPLIVALAVLLLAGGTGTTLLIRHFLSHPTANGKTISPVPGTTLPPSPAPPPTQPASPPTQLDIQGITIGIGAVNTDSVASNVATTMGGYFASINARNYRQAWNLYTPALRAAIPFQPWAAALSTTQESQVAIQDIQHDPNGDIDATVSFQSHQGPQYGPNQGETCTNWSLDYHLSQSSGGSADPSLGPSYLIDKVTAVGAGHAAC